MRHLVVGTAGHIDHGKSRLVLALTGTDPDRLKEEKARGITIELGFADLDLGGDRVLSFVDVPGHERFVRHMVAGASGIDAVLLVVAADQGVQPQTREHLRICVLLGVRHGLVVLTKTDLVDPELAEVAALEVREFVAGTFLEGAPLVPVSARTGRGLDDLREELGALFTRIPARPAAGVPRLPVDRAFVQTGFGTVVTGTLASGALAEGDEVEVLPSGRRARVRGLQVHRRKVAEARAGQRTAVNLQGLDVADVPRGSTVTHPGALATTRRIRARVELSPEAPERLGRGGRVRFHQGTCERAARLRVAGLAEDGPGLRAELVLDQETVLLPGDRFILRLPAPLDTVGGGTVLDARPPRGRRWGREEGASGPLAGLLERLERAGPEGRRLTDLAREMGLAPPEAEALAGEGRAAGRVREAAGLLFAGATWGSLESATRESLEAFHRDEPLRLGIAREDLRARVDRRFPKEAWRLLLAGLQERGEVRLAGERVASAGHRVVLSGPDADLSRRIEAAFASAGLEPPDLAEVTRGEDPGRAARVVDLLVAEGTLVRIRDGRLFHGRALDGLRDGLREYAKVSRTIDVAGFKERFGLTRKNAIPLLEQMDAERRTRRVGNLREILDGPA